MRESDRPALAPVSGADRIDVLDILRGIAILGIFFMNVPLMAAPVMEFFINVPAIGWGPIDQASWYFVQVAFEGTQRGLLQLLFGAGLMVMAARAMTPDGPVAVADLYLRRNLWLLAFGLFDVFVLLWYGDFLHIYAIGALFLFPFRKLSARWLLALGLVFASYTAVSGGFRYAERVTLMERAVSAQHKAAAGQSVAAEEKKALENWNRMVERRRGTTPDMQETYAAERKGHEGGFWAYAKEKIDTFWTFSDSLLRHTLPEAFCVMLLGIALWKWRILQGGRSVRFYLVLMLACYAFAIPLRVQGAAEYASVLPIPRTLWFAGEFSRIAMTIGHLALINLCVKAAAGRSLLAPFKAAGRTAFSLYLLQQVIGIYILFAPWWPWDLWDKLSWAEIFAVALAVMAVQLVLANLWLRWFAAGPFEWAWRSLSYAKLQPFRKTPASP